MKHAKPITAARFSSDERYVITASEDDTNGLQLWDAQTGIPVARFPTQIGAVRAIELTGNGKWLITGGNDKVVRLFDFATGKELARFGGHDAEVLTVAISPDGTWIASGAEDGILRMFRVPKELLEPAP